MDQRSSSDAELTSGVPEAQPESMVTDAEAVVASAAPSAVKSVEPPPTPGTDAASEPPPDESSNSSNPSTAAADDAAVQPPPPPRPATATETVRPPPKKKRKTAEPSAAKSTARTPVFRMPTVPVPGMRQLEFDAYSAVIAAFRAQGELTWQKDRVLADLRAVLKVSDERHKQEVLRADEVFAANAMTIEPPPSAEPKDRPRPDSASFPARGSTPPFGADMFSESEQSDVGGVDVGDDGRMSAVPEKKRRKKEKDPNAPKKERKPRDPNAPKKEKKPRDPNAPKKEKKPKVKKIAPRNPELSRELHAMLQSLISKDKMHLFAEPTTVEGYTDVITEPMDFATMRRKLDDDLYFDLESMQRDFELICNNAMTFNSPASEVYQQAQRLFTEGSEIVRFHRSRKATGAQREGQVFKLDLGARTVGLA